MIKICPSCGKKFDAWRKLCNPCYMRNYLKDPEKRKKHNHYGLANAYKRLTGNFEASFEENYKTHIKNKEEKRNELARLRTNSEKSS